MASNKFYANHSDNDEDVILLLGITSILQFDFNESAEIFFHTNRNIDHLIERFNWKKRPLTGGREFESHEVIMKFKEDGLELHSSDEVNHIPKHLLKSQHNTEAVLISKAWVIAKIIHEKKFSTKAPSKKIAFVYTSEVKEWISLLEANEALIAKWYRQRDAETDLTLVDISRGVQADVVARTAFACDTVVISKIALATAQFIKSVRSINPDIRLIIHGFESPSVYFASTHIYDLNSYLYESDLWLMSCKADEELASLSWKSIHTKVFPLKSPDQFLKTEVESSRKHILYFGRISEQKDLHEAIIAVSFIADQMRAENRKFKIYGYEDFLGLPHHRIPSLGYLEMLYKLAKKLGISDLVEFHPAIPQSQISDYLKEGIFLSTSFHSDENFGLVAFRALNHGVPVVLSEWGGHKDFPEAFSNVHFVPVYQFSRTPHINPYDLSEKLLEIWSGKSPAKRDVKWEKIELPSGNSRKLLEPSALKIAIENRIKDSHPWAQRRWPLYGKIFRSFKDDNYRTANLIYGARKIRKKPKPAATIVSPFVSFSEGEIKILDCTTGVLRYPREDHSRNIPLKQLGNDQEVLLSLPEWDWLWENGHMYFKGDL